MIFTSCPLCRGPVDVGSHWDCVFELLADWVEHRKTVEEISEGGESAKKVEGENG